MFDATIEGVILAGACVLLGACGGDDGGGGGGGGGTKVDACALVTQEDATKLFGQPATGGPPASVTGMLGGCVWDWENADADSHLLQFYIWDGEAYYHPSPTMTPYAIGEKGAIKEAELAVDILWVQSERVYDLSYFTVGEDVPKAITRADEVKALASAVSAKVK